MPEELSYRNELMDRKALKELVAECSHTLSNQTTADMVDQIKKLGFDYATQSGISIVDERHARAGREGGDARGRRRADRARSKSSSTWA